MCVRVCVCMSVCVCVGVSVSMCVVCVCVLKLGTYSDWGLSSVLVIKHLAVCGAYIMTGIIIHLRKDLFFSVLCHDSICAHAANIICSDIQDVREKL